MIRVGAVVLLALSIPCSLRGAEDDVSWTDKFTKSPSTDVYQLQGDIAWNPRLGGIRLNPGAVVAREAVMGFTSEVRADVWLPAGLGENRGLHVTLRERSAVNHTTVFLGLDQGKIVLAVMEYPHNRLPLKPAEGDDAGEGPWVLRLRLRYGVVQAKAWPKSQAEPTDWQVTRYTGDSGWEPRLVAVYSAQDAGLLERLQVRGEKPATDLFLKPDLSDETEKFLGLMTKSILLRKQGTFMEALPMGNEARDAARKLYGEEHAVTASCEHNLGAMLFDVGRYEEALKQFQAGLLIRRKVLPADHPHIAISQDGVGVALAALGRMTEAQEQYRPALELRRRVLGEDHPETAYSWNNLGQSQSFLADFPAAMESFQKSLKIRRAVFGEEHPDTAKAHNNYAYQLFAMGRSLEALPELERAVETYREILGENHPDTAVAENNLGYLYKAMGRFGPALERFEKALNIYTKVGGPRHILCAACLANKSLVYCEMGDYATARALLEEALSIRREVLGNDHPDTAMLQVNLAATVYTTGDTPTVVRMMLDAYRVIKDKLPPDHPAVARVLNNLAVFADDDGDPELRQIMRQGLETALAIHHERLGPHHPETLNVLNTYAKLLGDMGEAEEAEKLLTTALKTCEAELGADDTLTAYVRHNLGASYYQSSRLDKAEAELSRALESFRKAYGPRHPQTGMTLNLLSITVGAAGRHDEALQYAAESAAAYSDVARRTLAGTAEAQHALLLNRWRPEVRHFVALAAADPKRLGDRAKELFDVVLNWKAASGRSLLNRLEALTVKQSPEAKTYEEILVYRRQIVQETIRGAGKDSIDVYNSRLASLQERMDALERNLSLKVADYGAVAKVREAGVADILRHLPENSALVEYIYQPEIVSLAGPPTAGVNDDEFYAALVVYRVPGDNDVHIQLVPLPPAAEIDSVIEQWRRDTRSTMANSDTDAELREKLWRPIADILPKNVDRILIAPDGQLALIPFEAIRHDDGSFLIEKYRISYVTTGRDLVPRPQSSDALGPPVILADPAYDLAGFTEQRERSRVPVPQQSFAFATNPRKQKTLPGFDVEAKAVASLLESRNGGSPVRRLEHEDATEDGAAVVKRPRLLYFITHGGYMMDVRRVAPSIDSAVPAPDTIPKPGETPLLTLGEFGDDPRLRSILFLAGCNNWRERAASGLSDGLLTALEVQSLDLWGTDLVVASACDTGLGDVRIGEGVLGLRRAFQQAGARTVVSSLWNVPDEQTTVLMPRFLELWLSGTPKADALRQAQLDLIRNLRISSNPLHREASPFFWAAFVCHGLPQ